MESGGHNLHIQGAPTQGFYTTAVGSSPSLSPIFRALNQAQGPLWGSASYTGT